jgi:hypothetical protein
MRLKAGDSDSGMNSKEFSSSSSLLSKDLTIVSSYMGVFCLFLLLALAKIKANNANICELTSPVIAQENNLNNKWYASLALVGLRRLLGALPFQQNTLTDPIIP